MGFFLFFLISLDAKDEVYMNSVIIPDEKVRIVTNGTHLVIVVLNRVMAVMRDNARIVIAILIGFMFFSQIISEIIMKDAMSFV
jgi:hypothetical protein